MAEAFFNVLIGNLCSLIEGDIGLIIGVDEEMKKISSTLTTIQAVLEDAEMKQLQSKAIQNWLVKLSDLAYEIDDILDECSTEVSKLEHKNGKSRRYSLKKILFRREIGRRMKQVTEKLDAVAAERAKFHLRETAMDRPIEVAATRETGSILNESRLVYGRERDAKKIVDILVNQVNDNEEITVLPIIGVGGLGKTTLAQLMYNDRRVIEHFDQRIWVCVFDNFDVKTLMKAMIESGTQSASDLVYLDTLQRQLWAMLNNKRYLLVLDDVWNEDQEKWFELRNVLACGSKGSSIIVTTRLNKVANVMGTIPTYYLTGLSEKHCWMLLRECAFGQEKKEIPNLEAIGNQIVKKCAGVPLAAKALGGLLRFKRTEKEWNYVKESEIWELPQEETLILPALRLSYHHLPLALRQCFAHTAVFPKDSRIRKEELIFLLMGHGCISSKGALEVEDVGEEICNELVLRSLLQYVTDPVTKKTTLIMHDLVHDLAQSIMENKTPGTQVQQNVRSSSNRKIRQVNLHRKFVAFPTSNQTEIDLSFILSYFCRLRILDASWTRIQDLPSVISNLKHLRHLNLSENEICSLPNSLCSLWNLQVLNLDGCTKLETLPRKMRYLINLRHLFLENCKSLREMPSKIGELINLRTLSMFIVGHNRGNRLEELQCLKLRGKLTIRHLERVGSPTDAKKANLAEKANLCHLSLEWESENIAPKSVEEYIDRDEKVLEALEPHPSLETLEIKRFRGRCFPNWMSNSTLVKVVEIRISDCENVLCLPHLGELPHLKLLRLHNVGVEYIIEDEILQSGNGLSVHFPSLERLYLLSLPNIKGLLREQVMRSPEAFPNLEQLEIQNCSSLILPPLSSSSLKKLRTLRCGSLALASLSKLDLDTLADISLEIDKNMTCIAVERLRNLNNIVSWCIYKADELCLPEESLRELNFIKNLEIMSCNTAKCLPQGWLRHLSALEKLGIESCEELVELPEGIKYLNYLKTVYLIELPKMVCVPKALQHLSSSLQSLGLFSLPQLSYLPEWLDSLTFLELLYIAECPKIASLPDSIQRMKNLKLLKVKRCPEIERRCERGNGEDWHKIAHIPLLQIGE